MHFLFFLHRGEDSRKDHSRLAMLCATFPSVTLVPLTATASKKDVPEIKESSNLKSPLEVTVNPNKSNIFYEKSLPPRRRCRFHGRNSQAQCNTRENSDISTNFGFALKYSEKNLGINHTTLLLQKHSQKTACLLNFMLHSQRQLRIKF